MVEDKGIRIGCGKKTRSFVFSVAELRGLLVLVGEVLVILVCGAVFLSETTRTISLN